MLLPFAEKAHIDDQKLVGYCLSETHMTGKHKARVFKSALAINMYVVDFYMMHKTRKAAIRTAWIILFGESFPRLVSCYVKD